MIHRIAIQNFYCMRDRVEINLAVSGQVPEAPERFGQFSSESSIRIPRVVGLFGPNASGKSTILRVLSFINWFIQEGFSLPPKQEIPCFRFSSKKMLEQPVVIELDFDAPVDLTEGGEGPRCPYFYKIVMGGGGASPAHIESEELFYAPPNAARRVRVFERGKDGIEHGARAFKLEGYTRAIPKVVRPNVSLISTLAQLGHEPSIALREIAGGIETNLFYELHNLPVQYIAQTYMSDKRLLADLKREISKLDLGITEVQVNKPASERAYPEPKFTHRGLSEAMSFQRESEGTRQFFKIFPMLSRALHNGGVAVVDEFDSSLHPLILPEIIGWFYNPKRNSKGAQLWFTGQNPYVMNELPKESILFCQKDANGSASVFGLSDVRAVRRNDNFVKKYLGGQFGAVPHIG